MDKTDTEIAETNGAIKELDSLIDFVNSARVDEQTVRDYIQDRITVHQNTLVAQGKKLKKQRDSLKKTD